jgi:oligopeptide transport system substrate-binding protein
VIETTAQLPCWGILPRVIMSRNPKERRGSWFIPALLLVALSQAACLGPEPPQAAQSVLNRGNGAEPESLDMHKAATTQAGDVQRDLGEGLLAYTPTGELRTAAALRWEISADGLQYTFWLRPEARWSNGDPLTAADFVYSFRRLVDPATATIYVQSVTGIENAGQIIAGILDPESLGIESTGEYELTIRLDHALPYFLSLLTHPSTFPVHRGSIDAHGDAHARAGNLVSNGAYQLVDWQVGSYIELARNEHYWNNAATLIDRVLHHVTVEPMAELNRYRAGELDITRTIPPEAFAQMRAERPEEVRVSPSLAVYYYGFNLTRPPFAGKRKLRQALSMAIDREAIANQVLGRGEAPAYSWVPDGTDNYGQQRFSYADASPAARQRTARQLYQEAGYSPDKPLEVEIRYNTSDTHQLIALAVQSMWRDVLGVRARLINEEFQVLIDNIQRKEVTQVFRLNWVGDYNDAHTFLTVLESDNPSNLTGYQSDEFDSLMQRAAAQVDPARRRIFMEEAEQVMLADHPLIPIYFYVNKSMVKPRVRGWGDNLLNYHYSQDLSLAVED